MVKPEEMGRSKEIRLGKSEEETARERFAELRRKKK